MWVFVREGRRLAGQSACQSFFHARKALRRESHAASMNYSRQLYPATKLRHGVHATRGSCDTAFKTDQTHKLDLWPAIAARKPFSLSANKSNSQRDRVQDHELPHSTLTNDSFDPNNQTRAAAILLS